MESNLLKTVVLPIALGIIMLGLGLSLTTEDFKRVLLYPKSIFIGLFCQMIILPIVCFGIAIGMGLSPEFSVGLMLLSASPGGATANLFSHLSKGDVALNISLTAVNSLLSLFTLPLIVNFSIDYFLSSGQVIPIQFAKVIEVFAIVLIPVTLGMLIKSKNPLLSEKLDKPVKMISAIFLVIVILAAILAEKDKIVSYFQEVGLSALIFNVSSMLVGYFVPLMLKVPKKQAIAIGMEIGIHNGTLAIFIAISVIGSQIISIPAAVYSIIMFFTAAIFGFFVSRNQVQTT
jgi:BASS family bile acid:Na+ symporter